MPTPNQLVAALSRRQQNPHAPPAYSGLVEDSEQQYFDQDFTYTFDRVVAANATVDTQQGINTDSDFAWRAIVITSNTGTFSIQFSDSQWFYLSSALISSALYQGDASSPYPVMPELIIPSGGRIGIRLRDDSGAENTIQIGFRGVKRFPIIPLSELPQNGNNRG